MLRALVVLRRRPRLVLSGAVAAFAGLLAPADWQPSTRFLVGWDCGVVLYLILLGAMFARSGIDDLRRRAGAEDAGMTGLLLLASLAAVASLAAIGIELFSIRAQGAADSGHRMALAAATIALSWFFQHAIFAVHYAHRYHSKRGSAAGLSFPDGEPPDYWDFVYFAFTIGAAAQTADVALATREMRRTVLAHAILSFFFNACVLALAINIGAGLI
jgi:uncharacterized membrane protein